MTKLPIALILSSCLGFFPFSSFAYFPGHLLLLRHLLLLLFSLPGNDAYSFSFLILFSLDFLGCTWCYVFFFRHNFYCLINLGDCLLKKKIACHFFILIVHLFLTSVYK